MGQKYSLTCWLCCFMYLNKWPEDWQIVTGGLRSCEAKLGTVGWHNSSRRSVHSSRGRYSQHLFAKSLLFAGNVSCRKPPVHKSFGKPRMKLRSQTFWFHMQLIRHWHAHHAHTSSQSLCACGLRILLVSQNAPLCAERYQEANALLSPNHCKQKHVTKQLKFEAFLISFKDINFDRDRMISSIKTHLYTPLNHVEAL